MTRGPALLVGIARPQGFALRTQVTFHSRPSFSGQPPWINCPFGTSRVQVAGPQEFAILPQNLHAQPLPVWASREPPPRLGGAPRAAFWEELNGTAVLSRQCRVALRLLTLSGLSYNNVVASSYYAQRWGRRGKSAKKSWDEAVRETVDVSRPRAAPRFSTGICSLVPIPAAWGGPAWPGLYLCAVWNSVFSLPLCKWLLAVFCVDGWILPLYSKIGLRGVKMAIRLNALHFNSWPHRAYCLSCFEP